jgi:two-component system response regulator DesR
VSDDAQSIRIVLVEDHDVFRRSLEFLLGRTGGIEVVGSVALGGEAASVCTATGADVAVVDLRLPDVDGWQAAAEVRERSPETRIVFLSGADGPEEHEAARRLKAPLVRKNDGVDALVEAVRTVVEGRDR